MTRLLKITDLGSGIMVQGTNNVLYPDNATLTYPYNSIIVITDESNIATFRSASNNDVLFSGLIGKIEIGGEIVTKENINTKFDAIANKESGGGGGSFADASYDSQTKRINFYDNGGNIVSYIDATGFIKDGMVSNVAISEGNLVITFNTDAGKEPISIALTDIFNAANYYNKTEVDGKLALKADKTELPDVSTFATKEEVNAAVSAINTKNSEQDAEIALKAVKADVDAALALKADKAELPDVSTFATKTELNAKANTADLATVATSGSYNDLNDKPSIPERTEVDAALSDTSENPVQNKIVKAAIDEAKAYYIDFAVLSTQGITDADWDGIVASINAHRPIYAGLDNRYYTAECLYQDGSNIIRMTASDELNHFFYMFTKRGTNDYTMTYEVRPYVTEVEKHNWSAKQDALVSGTNIKTINNESILGAGNIEIQGGAGEQQQADWNQTDTTAVDYIKNKPAIPDTSEFITKDEYNPKELATAKALTQLNETKADKTEIPDVSTFATKTELNAKANTADLATVATSGSYNDLNDKPSIPDTTNLATKSELNAKQDALVSGTNIKTINGESLLGEGNITIGGGGTINIDQSVISGSSNAVSGGAVYTQFGGLKLEKITQSAYDALATKDADTLYVING